MNVDTRFKKGMIPWNKGTKGVCKPNSTSFKKRDGHFTNTHGYRVLYIGDNVEKLEHRQVMEEHLGRELSSDEVVHHINKDRLDNSISNLELFESKSDHLRHHWATDRRQDGRD